MNNETLIVRYKSWMLKMVHKTFTLSMKRDMKRIMKTRFKNVLETINQPHQSNV